MRNPKKDAHSAPLCILSVISLLCACSKNHAASGPSADTVEMRRSGCYGTCPAYTVEISSDGKVSYVGQDYVESKGKHERSIAPGDVVFLQKAFERVGFEHLQDSYKSETDGCPWVWTDSPTVEIVLKRGGQSKKVTYYYGCRGLSITDRINWLSQTIDEVAGTNEWVSAVPRDVTAWLKSYVDTQKPLEGKAVPYPEAPVIVEGDLDGMPSAAVLFDLVNIAGAGPGDLIQYLAVFRKHGEQYEFCCSHRVGGTRAGAVTDVAFAGHSLRLTGRLYVPGKDAQCCRTKPYVVDVSVEGSNLVDAHGSAK